MNPFSKPIPLVQCKAQLRAFFLCYFGIHWQDPTAQIPALLWPNGSQATRPKPCILSRPKAKPKTHGPAVIFFSPHHAYCPGTPSDYGFYTQQTTTAAHKATPFLSDCMQRPLSASPSSPCLATCNSCWTLYTACQATPLDYALAHLHVTREQS